MTFVNTSRNIPAPIFPTVYETLSIFGLKGQVSWLVCFIYVPTELLLYIMAISSDNATNNDTMMEGLELLLAGDGIEFSAEEACVFYMPHTLCI